MVGTAVYQVALDLSISDQKDEAENLPEAGSVTDPPAPSELSNPAMYQKFCLGQNELRVLID